MKRASVQSRWAVRVQEPLVGTLSVKGIASWFRFPQKQTLRENLGASTLFWEVIPEIFGKENEEVRKGGKLADKALLSMQIMTVGN